jgi:hypothetical protein
MIGPHPGVVSSLPRIRSSLLGHPRRRSGLDPGSNVEQPEIGYGNATAAPWVSREDDEEEHDERHAASLTTAGQPTLG